jgi:SPP1 family predicted phage head-tail adaptor
MPGAGQLREHLSFQARAAIADDGYGNREGNWVELCKRQARVMPLTGSETVIAARLTGVQPVVITVRYDRATREITTGHRAIDLRSGAAYNIRSTKNTDERKRYIEITAESGPPT